MGLGFSQDVNKYDDIDASAVIDNEKKSRHRFGVMNTDIITAKGKRKRDDRIEIVVTERGESKTLYVVADGDIRAGIAEGLGIDASNINVKFGDRILDGMTFRDVLSGGDVENASFHVTRHRILPWYVKGDQPPKRPRVVPLPSRKQSYVCAVCGQDGKLKDDNRTYKHGNPTCQGSNQTLEWHAEYRTRAQEMRKARKKRLQEAWKREEARVAQMEEEEREEDDSQKTTVMTYDSNKSHQASAEEEEYDSQKTTLSTQSPKQASEATTVVPEGGYRHIDSQETVIVDHNTDDGANMTTQNNLNDGIETSSDFLVEDVDNEATSETSRGSTADTSEKSIHATFQKLHDDKQVLRDELTLLQARFTTLEHYFRNVQEELEKKK